MSVYSVTLEAHRLLERRDLRHGFGGALALAYYADPRATVDVDLCVFVPWSQGVADLAMFGAIGFAPVDRPERAIPVAGIRLVKEGEAAPLDVFFSLDDRYDEIAERVVTMPFGPSRQPIPVLSVEDLVVFKLSFNRAKDWVDVDQVVRHGPELDLAYVERMVVGLRGPHMLPRVARLRAMAADAGPRRG